VPQRILVVKLADLGDLLTATPALRALRLSFPDARIDALVTPSSAPLLRGLDSLDGLVLFDKSTFDRPLSALSGLPSALRLGRRLRVGRYDTLLLLHHLTTAYGTAKYAALALASGAPVRAGLDNGRGRFLTHRAVDRGFGELHEVEYWLSVAGTLGASNPGPRLEIAISPDEDARAARRWHQLGLADRRTVILHPGSGAFSLARRWPAERYAKVADRLAREIGLSVAVLAGPAPCEETLAERVVGAMRQPGVILRAVPSPQELAALLGRSLLFVGNDSGVMHLAAAVERPIVAIFGPTNHRAWGPYPPDSVRNVVVREPLACSPCIHRAHSFGTPQGCPARTCLEVVDVEMVFEAAVKALGASL
jgi:lipopolysaccharide heptosyltransferase II